ncbi:MAG TPA: GNAT family N-acetyltransferase [Anaerolineae bacterium]|nr:GNAT family N-acetyltransferase [Anaerolineae bacterium]
MDYLIRPLAPADKPFVWEMLYQALHVPPGGTPFPRDIVNRPELRRYVEGWGRPDDTGFMAVEQNRRQPIGATWLRLMTAENRGFGYVDDATPELSIAMLPEYRGRGIGSALLVRLLDLAASRYSAVSLSVARGNPALRLYQRLGFEEIGKSDAALTLIKRWSGST